MKTVNEDYILLRWGKDTDPPYGITYCVCQARPVPESRDQRHETGIRHHPVDEDIAIADFFSRMRSSGLPGVIDLPDLRLHAPTPLAFCEDLTTHIWQNIEDEQADGDIESRVDDFDNHPLSPLREAMVNASPEYQGEEPPEPT